MGMFAVVCIETDIHRHTAMFTTTHPYCSPHKLRPACEWTLGSGGKPGNCSQSRTRSEHVSHVFFNSAHPTFKKDIWSGDLKTSSVGAGSKAATPLWPPTPCGCGDTCEERRGTAAQTCEGPGPLRWPAELWLPPHQTDSATCYWVSAAHRELCRPPVLHQSHQPGVHIWDNLPNTTTVERKQASEHCVSNATVCIKNRYINIHI